MSKPSHRKTREARKSAPGHPLNKQERKELKNKYRQNLIKVREIKNKMQAPIIPRTQANNRKSQATTIDEQQSEYENIVSAQLQSWRKIFPSLIKKLRHIKDPRQPGKIKHHITVILFLGLIQFIFKLKSRREYNEELTTPSVMNALNNMFPEINSSPHSETISRVLSRIDLHELESVHVSMIKELLNKKKFNKLFIDQSLPISIDASQKVVRAGQLQEAGWLLRPIITKKGIQYQQYVYVLEANITFSNGLTIPLLTEFCRLDPEAFNNDNVKQDSELSAFKRLSDKLKKYFPRRKIIILLDNLYACDNVIITLKEKRWDFVIKLPAKLKALYDPLAATHSNKISIPDQPNYREREQTFHWLNFQTYKDNIVHTVACHDKWTDVANDTGEVISKYSKHTWISSKEISIENVHLLCNLAGRKRYFIEDSFNTEKNRGYQYQHVFSYNWEAMQGFHLLMRMAHAINAICEFTKQLKIYIKSLGCANTLKRIFDGIKHRWISEEWIKNQLLTNSSLCFQFE